MSEIITAETSITETVSKKELLMRNALRLFAERGYQGVSLIELAKACSLSKGGLFHYIDSKPTLFINLFTELNEALAGKIEHLKTQPASMDAGLSLIKDFLREYPGAEGLTYLVGELLPVYDQFKPVLRAHLALWLELFEYLASASHEASQVSGAAKNALTYWQGYWLLRRAFDSDDLDHALVTLSIFLLK